MKLPPDFEQQLQHQTEAELLDVLNHTGDYLPGAVEAVTKELQSRKEAPLAAALLQAPEPSQVKATELATDPGPAEAPEDVRSLDDPSLSLAIVGTFRNVADAGLFRARLEAAGIEACIPEEYTPQIFWNVIPSPLETVTVRVAAKDYETAKAIHADYTDTALSAPHPGVPILEAEPVSEAAADSGPRKLCVACRAPIAATAKLCPKCGWTEPDI